MYDRETNGAAISKEKLGCHHQHTGFVFSIFEGYRYQKNTSPGDDGKKNLGILFACVQLRVSAEISISMRMHVATWPFYQKPVSFRQRQICR